MAAPLPDDRLDNTMRAYKVLDEAMWIEWRKDTDDGYEKGEKTARALLAHADLPLFYRARACMILGCTPSVAWAKEGVRSVRLGIQKMKDSDGKEPGAPELQLLADCESMVEQAEAAEKEEEEEGEEEEGEEEEEEEEGGDGGTSAPENDGTASFQWTEEHGWSDGRPEGPIEREWIEAAGIAGEPAGVKQREQPKSMSAADRLTIQEGIRFSSTQAARTGLTTPGVSRTASGDPAQAATQPRTGLATPGVSRTTSRTTPGNPGQLVRRRTSLRLSSLVDETPEKGASDDEGEGEGEDDSDGDGDGNSDGNGEGEDKGGRDGEGGREDGSEYDELEDKSQLCVWSEADGFSW